MIPCLPFSICHIRLHHSNKNKHQIISILLWNQPTLNNYILMYICLVCNNSHHCQICIFAAILIWEQCPCEPLDSGSIFGNCFHYSRTRSQLPHMARKIYYTIIVKNMMHSGKQLELVYNWNWLWHGFFPLYNMVTCNHTI